MRRGKWLVSNYWHCCPIHNQIAKPHTEARFKNPMECSTDTVQLIAACPPESPAKRRRSHKATRPQLLTRAQLDGRTNAAKVFDRLVANIETDLGGRDQLSTIERALVEGFAGAAVTLHNLNTRLALGETIDLNQHAQAVSAMVRVASRLGLRRRAKNVQGLQEYLASLPPAQDAAS